MEIFVIDNHSEDDSIGSIRAAMQHEPSVRIIETRANDGFGTGYNTGARYARGKYLLINNPDKKLCPDGVERLVRILEHNPTIGMVGPALVHPDGTNRLSIRRHPHPIDILARRSALARVFPRALTRYLMLDTDWTKAQDVDWIVGGCFLIRKELFDRLGGFDERFFLFFEDADLCRRCWRAGYRVHFAPTIRATDRPRRLSGESFWDLLSTPIGRAHLRSAVRYFWKWRKEGRNLQGKALAQS